MTEDGGVKLTDTYKTLKLCEKAEKTYVDKYLRLDHKVPFHKCEEVKKHK
jgi:hypothetical protein